MRTLFVLTIVCKNSLTFTLGLLSLYTVVGMLRSVLLWKVPLRKVHRTSKNKGRGKEKIFMATA